MKSLAMAALCMLALARPAAAPVDQDRQFTSEQTDRESRTVALGAAGALEVRGVSGDITVTAGSGRDAVVEIVRRSRGRSTADAARGLQQVKITVDQRGDRATIATEYPRDLNNPPFRVDVTYTITAPSGWRISASNVSGSITVRDIKGDVSADVVSGSIDITGAGHLSSAKSVSGNLKLHDVASDGTLSAGTVSGLITIDGVAARRLEADVVSGGITVHDGRCESVRLKSLSGTVEYAGTLSRGGRYELQSHSGNVRFLPAGGVGFDLQGSTFSGAVRVDPSVTLKSASISRRSTGGTVGDGGAVVVLTTFSGNVDVRPQ